VTDLEITKEDKIRCLKREVALRQRNYPRWISTRKMDANKASREIQVMIAILHDYEPLQTGEVTK
jgi:hypothetical protein